MRRLGFAATLPKAAAAAAATAADQVEQLTTTLLHNQAWSSDMMWTAI